MGPIMNCRWKHRVTPFSPMRGMGKAAAVLTGLVLASVGCQDSRQVLDPQPMTVAEAEKDPGFFRGSFQGSSSATPQAAAGDRETMRVLTSGEAPASEVVNTAAGQPAGSPVRELTTSEDTASDLASHAARGPATAPVQTTSYRISAETGGVVAQEGAASTAEPKADLPRPRQAQEREERDPGFTPRAGRPVIPAPAEVQLIDLNDAFNVAGEQNPTVGLARAEIAENVAILRQAQALLLPTLRAGTNYHYHNGNFQASTGEIKSRDLQAFYIGGGARTVAAESMLYPMIQIYTPITDAIFQPRVARAHVEQSRFAMLATNNQILMNVADTYLALVAAETRLQAIVQSESELDEVAKRTHEYWVLGQGSESDERRAQAEANLLRIEEQRLQEEIAVAAARLSQLLNLDPSVRLTTGGGPLRLLKLPTPSTDLEELLQIAMSHRPEIRAAAANIRAYQAAYKRERYRPLLPLLVFGYSAGSLGGGSNFYSVLKIAGNQGARTDLDAILVWTWLNMGLGNIALQKGQLRSMQAAEADLALAVNEVRREVVDSYALIQARQRELALARTRLEAARSAYLHDLLLIRNRTNIRPIELLNSVTRLYTARQDFIRALVGLNQGQLDLLVRLGQPPTAVCPEVVPVVMPDAASVRKKKVEDAQKRTGAVRAAGEKTS